MALLKFNKGATANISSKAITEGNIYITTDSQEMLVDISASKRIKISDFVIVENQTALEALGTYHENLFYYVKADNLLKIYKATVTSEDESHWKNINDTADLTTAISSLGVKITNLETKVNNLNATNISTTEKITVTTPVGNYVKGKEIDPNNLQQILLDMLCQDVNPSVTQPSISLSLTGAGAKEVGTKITSPAYSMSTNAGLYNANGKTQATNVTFSDFSITEVGRPSGQGEAATKTTQTGSFSELTVTDGISYKLTGHATQSDGAIPKTYLGKEYSAGQIKGKQLADVSSSTITGFRPIFYGMSTNTDNIDSDFVRNLTNSNKAPANMTITFTAANTPGVKRFIIAIPSGSVGNNKKVTKAIITSSMNADATSDYVKQSATVEVEGANGYTITKPYDIWIYQPASISANEVHSVTIG